MGNRLHVGITGQSGFIGTHLFNYLGVQSNIELIPFSNDFFKKDIALCKFVKQCDVILHLAALNRHSDPQVIYDTNITLVKQLISTMESAGVKPHVIFSSSVQEINDNPYGASKLEGRHLFDEWAKRVGARFTGVIIPNVFGPFGKPNYNSVVATFCYKLTHGEHPRIIIDSCLRLIYVDDLCKEFYRLINGEVSCNPYYLPHSAKKKVSEIFSILNRFKTLYLERGIIPNLSDALEFSLFKTFICYLDYAKHFPCALKLNADVRGSFVEMIKLENTGGQVSFSITFPGIIRGNHYHTRKIERFVIIKGRARIQLRRIGTKKILIFEFSGEQPAFVDIPIWYTHNITNVGTEDLYAVFWINEQFDCNDSDTFYEDV